uniref:Integrase catalytic domain-containing protein n=1 Tax=Tanacetum cinerariifolium TaxID=118510 RepID=A0A6L2MIQ5_TANCI|nr:hypothetical protein [Tanacetum cinerariifolium]
MTGNLKLLINFVEKFLRTVKFRNDQIAPILGYGDLVQGSVTIKRVYYVEGLNHNLFSVGQFYDADLEVAFRKSTCYIRDLKGNDLLTAWLWHRRLSHLNFDTINLLSKNDIVVGLPKLKFVKDHLCSSSSINGKRYVLVIVDDYSRYTWTHFLRSKDETPEVLIDFLRLFQRGLQSQVRVVRTDKGTEFLNQTLHAYFAAEGILPQTSVARTPEQNGIVERRNRTLVEAARTMLSAAKVPLFFWDEAIATACFTQNRSLVIPRHEKTPYHIINNQKLSVKFFNIFGSTCYIVRDGENLDKMKEKGDDCIFVGYSTQSRAYRVFNKRTRVIMESIHVNFDELPQMALDQLSFDPASEFVSKSSAVSDADAPNQRQHHITPLNIHTIPAPTCQAPPLVPTVISSENINQAETYAENDQVTDDEFINIFSTPEEVYVNQPDGFVDPYHPDKVYRLKKALYGPKQAPRAWYDELSKFLLSKGFTKIHQSPRGIFINQAKYAQEILIKHGMTSCDGIGTPIATKHLDADLRGTPVDQSKYHSKVGALMYLTASRPDIMHATCYCARYQAQPTEKHLTAVKQIFRYLKDTIHMGLWYSKDTSFELIDFLDSDHAGCLDSRKSTSGGIQFLEAEYMSLSPCCAQVLWMGTQLTDYGFHFDKIPMYCDSKAAIAISCNPVQHSRTKHIDIRYHFIKEKVEKGIVELFFVGTEYQLADLFAKALPVERFQYLVRRLGMRCLTPAELEALANESA